MYIPIAFVSTTEKVKIDVLSAGLAFRLLYSSLLKYLNILCSKLEIHLVFCALTASES